MTHTFKLILEEARGLGLTTDVIYSEREVVEISDVSRKIILKETFSLAQNPESESFRLSKNKEITHRLWIREGIPFPRSHYFRSRKSFPSNPSQLPLAFPVVFKKASGAKSIGVRTNIHGFDELQLIVAGCDGGCIIQEMAFGTEYRLLVYGDRILGALEMVPPQVIGNGRDSILTLAQKKSDRLDLKIVMNEKVIRTLGKRGMTPETVPADGTRILLQENSCLAEGGSSVDCTDIVHEKIRSLAVRAARVVNLRLAGIDLICEDISADPDTQKIAFLEANSFPSLNIHYEPTSGTPRRVIRDILSDIFMK